MLKNIRNREGIWVNTKPFRQEGINFLKNGYYCADPYESQAWYDYWVEQRKRCIYGYESSGVKITGEFYFYLNFCMIKKVEDVFSKSSRKINGFPDFWDSDYNYFWAREIAKNGVLNVMSKEEKEKLKISSDKQQIKLLERIYKRLKLRIDIPSHSVTKSKDKEEIKHYLKGGFNIIVGKARRRGFSYKNAAIAACNFFTKPNSLTILNAYEKKYLYPRGLMTMTINYINFINQNTAWITPSDTVNKIDHIRNSYVQYKDGIKIEKGFMSEIMALTCNDNPDVNKGKDADDIFFEEAGVFGTPGLLKSTYAASQDCVMAGNIKTGLITLFGTFGELDKGSADYSDMFLKPLAFDLLPFNNIWDKDSMDEKVGYFHPFSWNMEGCYDKEGNSDIKKAEESELKIRKDLIKYGASSSEIQKRMREKPLTPSEGCNSVSINNFPIVELRRQLHKVKSKNLQNIKGTPVEMYYEGSSVIAKPILNDKITPITSYYNVPDNIQGCPIIYEYPIPDTPKGLYKIGYDPIRQDEGTSLAAIIVYKGVHVGTQYHNIIVAEYVGRLPSADDIDRIAEKFADFYNTTIMYENEVTGVKNFFRRIKRLNLLSYQPDLVISKNIKKSKVSRIYGCHMTTQLKDAGERYIKEWLLEVQDYDENGDKIRVIDRIYSIRLLEELIEYNRKGNFDLISALIMCMFQIQEEELNKEYETENKKNTTSKFFIDLIDKMYIKNNNNGR